MTATLLPGLLREPNEKWSLKQLGNCKMLCGCHILLLFYSWFCHLRIQQSQYPNFKLRILPFFQIYSKWPGGCWGYTTGTLAGGGASWIKRYGVSWGSSRQSSVPICFPPKPYVYEEMRKVPSVSPVFTFCAGPV